MSRVKPPNAQLTHIGFFVRDLDAMTEFYTRLLGLVVSDRGVLNGRRLAFLTRSSEEHHQMVLISGRTDDQPSIINQISFRVDCLADLKRFHRTLVEEGVENIDCVTHGNAWSIYFPDPEGSRVELYTDTPWYVAQPMRELIDLDRSEEEIIAETRARIEQQPSFQPQTEWTQGLKSKLEG